MTKTKNKKYPFGKYVSEKTLEKRELEREKEKKDHERNVLSASEQEEAEEEAAHVREMNVENINQKYAANLIVMTIVGLYNIASKEYISENLKNIMFVLLVQTTNFGCTVYRAHLTETKQIWDCKFLPTVFKVVKAASYWLMLNVLVDYMDKHMEVTNYTTLLKWSLIISNKGFIAYLAYSILLSEGMLFDLCRSLINLVPEEDEEDGDKDEDDEDENSEDGDSSDDEEEEGSKGFSGSDEEEETSDKEETSNKKNN